MDDRIEIEPQGRSDNWSDGGPAIFWKEFAAQKAYLASIYAAKKKDDWAGIAELVTKARLEFLELKEKLTRLQSDVECVQKAWEEEDGISSDMQYGYASGRDRLDERVLYFIEHTADFIRAGIRFKGEDVRYHQYAPGYPIRDPEDDEFITKAKTKAKGEESKEVDKRNADHQSYCDDTTKAA